MIAGDQPNMKLMTMRISATSAPKAYAAFFHAGIFTSSDIA